MFAYGGPATGRRGEHVHDGPYAVVDVETTGFSPTKGDRVVEIAIARVDASGRIEDEWSTLLNPDGRDTGAVHVHRITDEAVRHAPRFADVLPDVLHRLDGAVVVAHNAAFEERFLAAELASAGASPGTLPALCTMRLAQATVDSPDHKLGTLARRAGITVPDAHTALGDVRALAALLPGLIAGHPGDLAYRAPLGTGLAKGMPLGLVAPLTRTDGVRRGADGWMHSMLGRLPASGAPAGEADAQRYLQALGALLADGATVAAGVKAVARLVSRSSMGAAQVSALNRTYLESLRSAALSEGAVSRTVALRLRAVAAALASPGHFDDLTISPGSGTRAGSSGTAGTRRCGHCRQPGHVRTYCPQLR